MEREAVLEGDGVLEKGVPQKDDLRVRPLWMRIAHEVVSGNSPADARKTAKSLTPAILNADLGLGFPGILDL